MVETVTNPPAVNSAENPPATGQPVDPVPEDQSTDCNLGSGSPSFMDGEGGSPAAVGAGDPVPAMSGGANRPTNKDFKGNDLPPIPSSGNYNNMGSFRLSYYFTLGQFLNPALGAPSIPLGGKRFCNRNWSAQQLVQNMRDLCVLCLDPIKDRYRNMTLTSTFRNKAGTSAHDVGWAADMQFHAHGFVRGNLINVAREIASMRIPYDQLLYEYSPARGTSNPWIHIGYRRPSDGGGQRGAALTFYNDRGICEAGRFVQFPRV